MASKDYYSILGVSRNAIHKVIQGIEEKLTFYIIGY